MTYRRQLRKQSGAVGKRGGMEMIKSKCKNGKCRIKTEGRPKDMADECAYIMISVAKRIKKIIRLWKICSMLWLNMLQKLLNSCVSRTLISRLTLQKRTVHLSSVKY